MRESKESEAASLQSENNTDYVGHPVGIENQQSHMMLEQAYSDIEAMLQSDIDLHDKEKYATLLLWDFAGDEEFYHTHQTFLSPDAIYLVVTKLNEADDKKAQDLFRFWMDSIHCYSKIDEMKNEYEDNTRIRDNFHPPVVIVGTWKDAVKSEKEKIEDACRKNLLRYTDNMAQDERSHIRHAVFISNTEDNNSVFQQIRQDILKFAKTNRTWNTDYPLKFIQLEKRLQEKKKELPIITFKELKHISTETSEPLRYEELILFLKFHHEIRALVYFEDLPDYIILDPQWLSDAFKCIVTAKEFRAASIQNQQLWKEFYHKGKLHEAVLEDIFQNEENIFYEHKEHILNVMEKFDIIIRPIKPGKILETMQIAIMEYEVAEVGVLQQDEGPNTSQRVIALFRGTAVFELKKTSKLTKLLITTCPNIILIQILEFGRKSILERGMYKHIADFVTDEINKIISTRFKMTNVKFEKKWDCGQTKPESVIASNDFSAEEITEYYCDKCRTTHEFRDEWSDLQGKALCSSEEITETNVRPETTRINQIIATKVRCFFKTEVHAFSNVFEESTRPGNSTGLTKEEFNFAKMGMIVLNILTNVLYDLLKQDKTFVRTRSDCDITYLYSEQRRINKHTPSNGWGGLWHSIQSTDISIGDDIERIRLTRNEIFHSETFKIDEKRYTDLCKILDDLLSRFDLQNKPVKLYIYHFNEIVAKTISEEEVKVVHRQIEHIKSEMAIEVEIEHEVNVAPQ
ncbi:unnamed protein product [Mytilus edulis]|uniref:COR domain-containing protein n=1 Tax=Mytilus edulis TaxID=6550 RepID=A0A8S3U2E2_MYTED|nr:unnamed protein product [Mytilus edulis]